MKTPRRFCAGRTAQGFSLIELLVVVSIIAVLASMLMPAIVLVRDAAHRVTCLSKIRQIGLGTLAYNFEQDGLPTLNTATDTGSSLMWGMVDTNNESLRLLCDQYLDIENCNLADRTVNSRIAKVFSCPGNMPKRNDDIYRLQYNMVGGSWYFNDDPNAFSNFTAMKLQDMHNAAYRDNPTGLPTGPVALWCDAAVGPGWGQRPRNESNHKPWLTPTGMNVVHVDGSARWYNYSPIPTTDPNKCFQKYWSAVLPNVMVGMHRDYIWY